MSLNVFVKDVAFPISIIEYHTADGNQLEHHTVFNYQEFIKELDTILPNERHRTDDYASLALLGDTQEGDLKTPI